MKISLTLLTVLAVACNYGNAARLPAGHRILGGAEVDITQHPHQLTFHRGKNHVCGASIISRKWAVTAAHCIHHSDPTMIIWLGAGNNHRENGTFYKVSQMIIHHHYNHVTQDYDIGLLKIEGEFQYGDNVQPIRLPGRELQTGEYVNVTGWGHTETEFLAGKLMGVTLPIIDHKICEDAYAKLPSKPKITTRMICAGFYGIDDKDSCQGDSGGPLSANNTLYGIVSFGFGCGDGRWPGVYANVAELRPWITSVTGI